MLEKNIRINSWCGDENNPLEYSIRASKLSAAKIILLHLSSQQRPLVLRSRFDLLHTFLAFVTCEDYSTLLCIQCWRLMLQLRPYLLLNLEFQQGSKKLRPLDIAVFRGQPEIVEILLDSGANKDATDACGNNALAYAATGLSRRTVRLLLDKDVDRRQVNSQGLTARDFVKK